MEFQAKRLVPLATDTSDDKAARRRMLKSHFDNLLHIHDCAEAVGEFKGNGIVKGHKVLDTRAAVEVLIAKAPESMQEQIAALQLDEWTQCQVLNAALRARWQLGKDGKLVDDGSGQPLASKRMLEARAKEQRSA